MKLSWTFKDLTVHVVQETRTPVMVECQYLGDAVVVHVKDVSEQSEEITKVEGLKTLAEGSKTLAEGSKTVFEETTRTRPLLDPTEKPPITIRSDDRGRPAAFDSDGKKISR